MVSIGHLLAFFYLEFARLPSQMVGRSGMVEGEVFSDNTVLIMALSSVRESVARVGIFRAGRVELANRVAIGLLAS